MDSTLVFIVIFHGVLYKYGSRCYITGLVYLSKETCSGHTNSLSVCTVVDLVLIMSVNPGFGGQSFIESQVKKISDLRRLCAEKVT